MNSATFTGILAEVMPQKEFLKDKTYFYTPVVFNVGDEIIVANYWKKDELPPLGSKVKFTVKIASARNNNNPDVFYHKINLQEIYELHSERNDSDVQHKEGCPSSRAALD